MITIKEILTAYGAKTLQELANIPEYVAVFGTNGIEFSYVDETGTTLKEYITADLFFNQLEHYYSWCMNSYDTLDAFTKFLRKLKAHLTNKEHAYNRMLLAIRANYSPIENVDEKTTESTDHTGTIENEGESTLTVGGKRATATDNNVTTNNYANSWDSANDIPNGKQVGSGSVVTTSDQSQDETTNGNTETIDTNDTLTRNRHGNIGVTESTTLWLHELDSRARDNLVMLVVNGFANEYLWLCEGVY